MTPHFPKPMFLAQVHLGPMGALAFIFPQTDIWALRGFKGPPGFTFGPLGPLRALLVLNWALGALKGPPSSIFGSLGALKGPPSFRVHFFCARFAHAVPIFCLPCLLVPDPKNRARVGSAHHC